MMSRLGLQASSRLGWLLFYVTSAYQLASALPLTSLKHAAPFSREICQVKRLPFHIRSEKQSRLALFASSKDSGSLMSSRQKFLVGLGAILTLAPLVEVYSRAGSQDFPEDLLSPPQNGRWDEIEHATLVFHGSGGQDQYTDALMKKVQDSSRSCYSSMIEWSQFSSNIFQASFNGQRIGRQAAARLLQKAPNLKSIQFIGISVGAFAADAATTEAKSMAKGGVPYLQLTLLDPFTQRGIFDFGYGSRTFGKSADYVEQYLNTDDPVPSTNSPLENAVCYDITNLRPDDIFGHDWPVVYYAQSGRPGITSPDDRLERGTVLTLEK
jgi:hypothetical protein